MRRYAALAVDGDDTAAERRTLLERHADDIRARISELTQCLAIVEAKVDLYAGRLDDPGVVWELVAEAQRHQAEGQGPGEDPDRGLRGPQTT